MSRNNSFAALFAALVLVANVTTTQAQQCWVMPGGNPFHTGLHQITRGPIFSDVADMQEMVWLEDGRVAVGYHGFAAFSPKRGIIRLFAKVNTQLLTTGNFISPPNDANTFSFFASHLAASGNFIAATYRLTNNNWAVAVYEATNANDWAVRGVLQPDVPVTNDNFGAEMAMSGRWLAVAHVNNTNGGIYMFRRNDEGEWERKELLHLPGFPTGLTFNSQPMAMRGDVFAVGHLSIGSGSVHLWRLQPNDTWAFETTLTANDATGPDSLGGSLALAQDEVFAGAPNHDDGVLNSGAVYVFKRTGGVWAQSDKIRLSNPKTNGVFGSVLDHSEVGPYLCVGDNTGIHQFKFLTNQWVRVGRNGGGSFFDNWPVSATNTMDFLYGTTNAQPTQPMQRGRQMIVRFNSRVCFLEYATTTIITRPITNTCYSTPLGWKGVGPSEAEVPDLDQDRIGDFEEGYFGTFLDTNNIVPGGLTPIIPAPGGGLKIQWPHALDTNVTVQAEPQWSTNLQSWTTNGIAVQNLGLDPLGTEREILQTTLPPSPNAAYFRLRFIVPPNQVEGGNNQ